MEEEDAPGFMYLHQREPKSNTVSAADGGANQTPREMTSTLDQYIEDLREANKEADLHKLSLLDPA